MESTKSTLKYRGHLSNLLHEARNVSVDLRATERMLGRSSVELRSLFCDQLSSVNSPGCERWVCSALSQRHGCRQSRGELHLMPHATTQQRVKATCGFTTLGYGGYRRLPLLTVLSDAW